MHRSLVLSALALVFVTSNAEAKSFRVQQIPNGGENKCATCHVSERGGGARNDFGISVENTLDGQNVNWAALYNIDSDGDGFTNGEELGDPLGTWTEGAAGAYVSHPGVPEADLCGNGMVEVDEECDGAIGPEATCEAAGLGAGTITCSALCKFDLSGCGASPLNNENNTNNTNTNNTNTNNTNTNTNTNNTNTNNTNTNTNNTDVSKEDDGCATAGGKNATPLALLFAVSIFMRRLRRRDINVQS